MTTIRRYRPADARAVESLHERVIREGIGSRLLAGLEDAARERGLRRLYARTARRQSAAVAFYPANGYRQIDTEAYREYDLVVYRKDLRGDP